MGVLIVGDEQGVGALLQSQLRRQGVDAVLTSSLARVAGLVEAGSFAVVIVDVAADGGTGLRAVSDLRRTNTSAHVIVLSPSPADADRAEALDLGADDFVVKPLLVREVANRVLAVRRREDVEQDRLLRAGPLTIDLRARRVHAGDRLVELTPKEFDLLAYLAARPGHVFTHDQLLRTVWWSAADAHRQETVSEHVEAIRAKVEPEPAHPRLLVTVDGVGFRFDRHPVDVAADDGPPAGAPGVVVHVDGRIVSVGPELLEMLGHTDEGELVGRNIVDLVTPSSRRAAEIRREAVAGGLNPLTQLMDIARADGTELAVEVTATTVDWQGAPARRVVLTPLAEPSVRLRRLMTGVLSEMADAVVITDLHFHVRSWNRAAERLYGWSESEVVGRHMLDILEWGGDNEDLDSAWRSLELRGRWHGERRQATRDGSVLGVLASTTLVRDDAGEAIGFVSVNRPVHHAADEPAGDSPGAAELRRALEAGELAVHYQPVVTFDDPWHIVTLEALVRWDHPDRGLLSPAAFIATAERDGSIIQLGALVLDTACRQVATWRAAGFDVDLAVNLSVRELSDPALVDRITSTLRSSGLEPSKLWLEVTETALVEDVDTASTTLHQLADLGINIAIDDFGTGWASLTYLRSFPVHALKIDRSFVTDLTVNPSDQAIARSIISLGAELGLFVVAEGIETHEQRQALEALGCSLGQGYLFARPTPAADVPIERARRIGAVAPGRGRSSAAPSPGRVPAPPAAL